MSLYEDDVFNQLLLDRYINLSGDRHMEEIAIAAIPKSKGDDFFEGDEQELFVTIEVPQLTGIIESKTIDVDVKSFKPDPPDGVSVSKVGVADMKKEEEEKGACVCKEYDLIWGSKVSCEFRKKVFAIAKRLNKDPNLLMAAMALETNRTFSPTAGKGKSYVGLIQFGDAAAESVGTTRSELLKMTALEQLDYVEKYLDKKKDKLVTLTDFYLSIIMPVDVGKGSTPNHVVFDNEYPLEYKKDGKTLTDLSKSRHYGYRQNPSFLYEDGEKKKVKDGGGKKYDGPGKTYIWEIEKFIDHIYNEGKAKKQVYFYAIKTQFQNRIQNWVPGML